MLWFAASAAFSFLILWLMSAMIGMVAFWVAELGNLGMVKDAVVRVLSGSLVPLWFFPELLRRVSEWLPFSIYVPGSDRHLHRGRSRRRGGLSVKEPDIEDAIRELYRTSGAASRPSMV